MTVVCPQCSTQNTRDSRFCKTCATPLAGTPDTGATLTQTLNRPLQELSPGALFAGRYQIIEDLGQGGMGHVFKALDTRTGEKIAIKVLRPALEADGRTLERFGHELTAARRISHRNVCRMFDLGEDGGRLYITMEFVPGEDLKSILRMMGAMSPAQAVSIAVQICDGLEEAHRLGVVHRDLKPANVLVDREGHARIMDFGIARSGRSRGITDAGTMVGTPDYMSPEQTEGRDVDGRADLYSLGVMLFEMVAGRLPFEGDTALAVALMHRTERPPDPKSIVPGLPADLSKIILKGLEKDRGRRYQSAGELRGDLVAVAAGLPTASRVMARGKPSTSREITVKLPLKRLVWPTVGVIALAAAAVFLLPVMRKGGAGRAVPKVPGSVAVVAFENQTGDTKYDPLRKVIPSLLITNLENTGLFQVTTWERMRDVLGQMGRKGVDVVEGDAGFDFCRHEGVAFIVVGSFSKVGDTFVTEFKLLDPDSRRMVATAAARGTGEDSILNAHIDELSTKIAAGMGVGGAKLDATRMAVADLTTRSTEAYAAYLRGLEQLDKFDDAAARKEFEEAIRIDPDFAIAHLRFGQTLEREADWIRVSGAYQKAMDLSSRAPEKERRLIESKYANRVEKDRPKATAILKELVAKYPREKELRVNLGDLLMAPDPDAAIVEFRAALALDPDYGLALNEMAFALIRKGDNAGAVTYLERYAAVAPNEYNPRDSLGQVLLMLGRLDEALANYEKALSLAPRMGEELPIAYVLALKEDYPGALAWLDRYIASVPSDAFRSEGPVWQGILCYLMGRRHLAFERLDSGLAMARNVRNDIREGVILGIRGFLRIDAGETVRGREDLRQGAARLESRMEGGRIVSRVGLALADAMDGAYDAADAGLAEIDKILPPERRVEVVEARIRYTKSMILLGRGQEEAAFRLAAEPRPYQVSGGFTFQLASLSSVNMPFSLDGYARALAERGRLDEAIEEYRLLMTVSPETNNRYLINPLYHFRVAGIYEKKGDKTKAVAHYKKFLEIWKDADPELPEPSQAKARLAALEK